jgi:PAS domain S-box-containing protein
MTTKTDLQAIAETHERPFLIIDKDSRIVAANSAFLKAYGTDLSEVLGRTCHDVTHGNPRPCHELGEECPIQRIRETQAPHACLHIHCHHDQGRHIHQVRVKGFPLVFEDGEPYYGELMEEIAVREESRPDDQCMIGSSKAFLAALEAMKLAAGSDAPVLIQGETGTGKELAAAFVHRNSQREQGPFLTLDCTVLTETLVESELFGHERGAFTGSVGDRQGLFKLADGGTLFLDEVGEMPKQLQTKLLRVLESGEFRRVGGSKVVRTDVRILCATNRDLAQEVKAGSFREDLYYRLACLTIRLPSLRERPQDIRDLAAFLLERIPGPGGRRLHLTEDAVGALQGYDFPGNVRELRNILQAAATHATGATVDGEMIEQTLTGLPSRTISEEGVELPAPAPQEKPGAEPRTGMHPSLQALERDHLARLLEAHRRDRRAVAEALGVSVRTVYRKLKRHGLG